MIGRASRHFARANRAYGTADAIGAGAASLGSLDLSAGQVLLGDGTVGAPALAFKSDTDTGLYLSTTMRAAFGGSDVIVFSSNTTVQTTLEAVSRFNLQSALQAVFAIKTGDFTATTASLALLFAGTNLTLTLPASPGDGQVLFVKNMDATALTVARNGKLIDDAAANDSIASGKGKIYGYSDTRGSWYILGALA